MVSRMSALPIILALSFTFVPAVYAESTVSINMEKTTYTYCEKLFYVIEVSEVTGDPAIIHIRDETGKGSSAIPISITDLQNPVPSLVAFNEELFPLGKYFIDVEYDGQQATAEFTLIDSNKKCIPQEVKAIMNEWLFTEDFPDGFVIDAFKKFADSELINIPFEINEKNIFDIDIPEWVKYPAYWWIQGAISDGEFAQTVNYLLEKKIISTTTGMESEI